MLQVTQNIAIPDNEIEFQAVRAQGPGGQNVNKVSSAVHLRFDISRSSLPEEWKQRLLQRNDQRITQDGIIIIKAQRSRSQEKNREDALQRLHVLLLEATTAPKERKPTRPSRRAREKRLGEKSNRSTIKSLRSKLPE